MSHTPATNLKDNEIIFDRDREITITCDTYEILDDIREPEETLAEVIDRLVKILDR